MTQLILRLAGQAHWFADVGANVGWYTCLVAKMLPGGKVDAFEMNPAVCKILEKNIRRNNLDARVHNVAMAAEPGEVLFLVEEAMGTYVPRNTSRTGRTCQVKGRTLDEFCKEKTGSGLIKIDVEGAEADVLLGMTQLLQRQDVELLIELHPWALGAFGSSPGRILEILQGNGFEVRELRGLRRDDAELAPVDASQIVENTMIWATKSPAAFG